MGDMGDPTNIAEEFGEIRFGDKRLDRRFAETAERLGKHGQGSVLSATGERNSARGFYRLLENDRFSLEGLQSCVRETTAERLSGKVLLIQDTSDINLNGHKKTEGLGFCSEHTLGVKIHSCIAVSPDGIPLGLLTQQYETRAVQKDGRAKEALKRRPLEEKESYRWLQTLRESLDSLPPEAEPITVCDREGDFYELYAQAQTLGADFVIRVIHDRQSDKDEKTVTQLRRTEPVGVATVTIPRDSRRNRKAREVDREVAYTRVTLKKPKRIAGDSPEQLNMTLVRISERSPAKDKIEWVLATNSDIGDAEDCMRIVGYYIRRWQIERFHFVLKSGYQVERIQQRTVEKIKSMLFIYSVLAMYVMKITLMARVCPDWPCDVFLDETEWKFLYRIVKKTKNPPDTPYPLSEAVRYLAELGSYKRALSDGAPGLKSVWQGLFRLFQSVEILVAQV
jgi:hypothetical protein